MQLNLTLQVAPQGAAPNEAALAILIDELAHLLEVTFERFNLGNPKYELKIVETAGE